MFERIRSHRGLIIKGLAGLGLVAGLAVVTAAPASADPYWHNGIYGPRVYPSAGYHGGYRYGYNRPYYSRPYVYVAPAPVYYAPPPVYYAPPAPVYYAPPPAYYPPPVYYPRPAYYAPRPLIGIGIGLPPLVFRIH